MLSSSIKFTNLLNDTFHVYQNVARAIFTAFHYHFMSREPMCEIGVFSDQWPFNRDT